MILASILSRVLFKRRRQSAKSMLIMVDLDNILSGLDISQDPRSFSLIDGFDRMLQKLGRIAPIVHVFAYGPPETLTRHAGWLGKLQITTVQCNQVVTKSDVKISKEDTVDHRMIEDGKSFLREMTGVSHLCLWTGDQDFVELARAAKMTGREVIIVAGREESLSKELARFASNGPDGERAVYIFSAQS